MSDASGLRVSIGIQMVIRSTRSKHAALDVAIFEPRGKFHGLVIELKAKKPFTAGGQLSINKHIQDQQKTVMHLTRKGYMTLFAWTLDQAIDVATKYLAGKYGN